MPNKNKQSRALGNYLGVHVGGVVICLLMVGLVYAFGYRPYATERVALRTQQSEFDRIQGLYPTLIKENRELKAKYQEHASVSESNRTGIYSNGPVLDLVSRMLLNRDVKLKNFAMRGDTPKSTTINLQVAGAYENLARLLNDFDQMSSPAKLLDLQMNSTSSDGQSCSAGLTIHFTKVKNRRAEFDANVATKNDSRLEGASNG